jgi:hypothetical protein
VYAPKWAVRLARVSLDHDDADFSFSSRGDLTKTGEISYTLSNGQVDRYPLSLCVENERCYQALTYFFVNGGAKPNWITWKES